MGAWSSLAVPEKENRRKLFNSADFGQFLRIQKAVKSVLDHIFDHLRDHNLIAYRGVAQLIARRIWDAEAASLSLATPTNNPLKQLVLEDFCIYF